MRSSPSNWTRQDASGGESGERTSSCMARPPEQQARSGPAARLAPSLYHGRIPKDSRRLSAAPHSLAACAGSSDARRTANASSDQGKPPLSPNARRIGQHQDKRAALVRLEG